MAVIKESKGGRSYRINLKNMRARVRSLLHVNLTTFFCSSYTHGGLQKHCVSKNDLHSLYI